MGEVDWIYRRDVDWIYRRDNFDLTLHKAADVMACADLLEHLLIPETLTLAGECSGHLPPETVLGCYPQIWASALDVLHLKAYRYGQRVAEEDYRHLLARVGRPAICNSPHATDEQDFEYWPQPDWQATREDLLHFFLLLRAEYADLKARLQARPVGPEALYGLTEAAGKLLDSPIDPPETIEDFKKAVIRSWERVEWSPPEPWPPQSPQQRSRWSKWLARLFSSRRPVL